ncbi:MAG: HAMP domain-containing protein [Deltaproteobacteria bacterium]|nr:HAMP domain-containing protein [Deltaproteobacteria bacterium]
MTLRFRIAAAMLLAVTIAVGATSASHVFEVVRRFESILEQQTTRVSTSIHNELKQTRSVLDEELLAARRKSFLQRAVGGLGQGRYLAAKERLRKGRLEILKVLDDKGGILTSGAWPASWGALDSNAPLYATPIGDHPRIVDEATENGQAPSLQRWSRVRWQGRNLIIVAGRFLDESALEAMRARVGADLLALCRIAEEANEARRCLASVEVGVQREFNPKINQQWAKRFYLDEIQVAPGKKRSPTLVIGLDRTTVEQLSDSMLRRALLVGGGAFLLAVLLGIAVATRVVRPVEALAKAAADLSEGKLNTRVAPTKRSGSKEVDALVVSFNQMAAHMETSQAELKRAERVAAWREIARGLAHELKNPLTPIRGAMDVIRKAFALKRPDFEEILEEQASAVVEEVGRLKELSDAFARFARLPDPQPEMLFLEELTDHALNLYVDQEIIEVVRRYPSTRSAVFADRTQIATVITNLVKNAAEAILDEQERRKSHGEKDEAPKRISATLHNDGDFVSLSIGDSGPGIAPDMKERLFTPYATTKGSRGTGLGLALVHRIVVEHDGEVNPGVSEEGGASFVIRLPLSIETQKKKRQNEVEE